MKKSKVESDIFNQNYLSVVQILMKLADPTFLFGEVGRGSGKTTHMLSPRVDRVQNDMPGAVLVLGASTYKSIFDNILAGLIGYFQENYIRGIYYEVGKEPPRHFKPCTTFIDDWRHTVSFHTGTVIQFVSCDRPESMLGKNAAHLFIDEMLRIPEDKFTERIIPALRADRSKFGHSHYFMGITGFSSTPNFETDEDWWTKYEKDVDWDLIACIQEMAYELDIRLAELEIAKKEFNEDAIKQLTRFVERWGSRINSFRKGETYYLRASSFSNLKILGIDYIINQVKSIKDEDKLNTSIFSVRKQKVKDMFFGKFGKEHVFDDSYVYNLIDTFSADMQLEESSRNLKYCNSNMPLYAGFDPGPFMSIVFGQRQHGRPSTFRAIKNFWVIHPEQHEELAEKIDTFFKYHRRKEIFLHYDRAANQNDPHYRKYYPLATDLNDTDAILLQKALVKRGWSVKLMSLNQSTIYHHQHYRLLNILFSKPDGRRDNILIDRNECDALISSINHSPIKRTDGRVQLDKSSEKELEYKDQAYYSTQIATAFLYLLWGEYKHLLPEDSGGNMGYSGTYSGS
ncbi:hypothetical protein [Butyricimonas virosa]|jgi:hypothetical protein|uniref:hypothetical protein n=1 Tax=Butyricimonas virosa TaxID=544645 RepID=UPI00266CAEFF|nr:hypothetical protein [Butyricimonas virosa]MBS5624642.1 hypothetical protein [Porphyromonadaceae bacterium]